MGITDIVDVKQGPCSAGYFLAYKSAVTDLLWEKNTVPRLISRAVSSAEQGEDI
jgi:hypothetical protein